MNYLSSCRPGCGCWQCSPEKISKRLAAKGPKAATAGAPPIAPWRPHSLNAFEALNGKAKKAALELKAQCVAEGAVNLEQRQILAACNVTIGDFLKHKELIARRASGEE